MPTKVYAFNVGDGNFTVSFEGQEMVIQDAGRGPGAQKGYFQAGMSQRDPGFNYLKKIIDDNKTTRVRTLITHQHKDHMRLLPDVFRIISDINRERSAKLLSPIEIGKFYVGGNRERGKGADQYLCQIPKIIERDIKVEYIGNENTQDASKESQIVHSRYTYGKGGCGDKVWQKSKDVSFGFGKKKDQETGRFKPFFSIVTPAMFQGEQRTREKLQNGNDINLVGVLKDSESGRHFWFTGDATSDLLARITAREDEKSHTMLPPPIAIMSPHHGSPTDNQTGEWLEEGASRDPLRQSFLAFCSTARSNGKQLSPELWDIIPDDDIPKRATAVFKTGDLARDNEGDFAYSIKFPNVKDGRIRVRKRGAPFSPKLEILDSPFSEKESILEMIKSGALKEIGFESSQEENEDDDLFRRFSFFLKETQTGQMEGFLKKAFNESKTTYFWS